ncbi:MAG: outer membrane lipoprotein chaperone LolA [Gammaproteobacteria bacterium]|nr:outer membrane lipoprotein chaperone LolA [Pseudomonadota bacterium]MCZ6732387.1 outer membrane lipoprotein chaperone LolA [Gammaproteobacteria bacterium]
MIMRIRGFTVGSLVVIAMLSWAPQVQAADDLQRFFSDVQSYTAKFSQVVLDESFNTLQESSGTLWIQRPDKFRWDYDIPFEQHIVGDGERIWVHDVELQQVTVRRVSGGLGATPALLLAGRGKLEENFSVNSLGSQGQLEWTQLIPKNKDGGYEEIRIGFENGRIRMLEMIDGFGQTTRIVLRDANENVEIDAGKFVLEPPPGTDVVGEIR